MVSHGAFRHPQQLTDLAMLPFLQVVQQHDLTLMLGQCLERGGETGSERSALGITARGLVAGRIRCPLSGAAARTRCLRSALSARFRTIRAATPKRCGSASVSIC